MAPSPTGNLHIGTARATLFNYLFAKKNGGKFILRIEDTDKERSKKEFEDNILSGLEWLGLTFDEFFRQSERTEIYVNYVKKMIEEGSAYISKEEPKEEGQRSEVVRFKNPNKKIVFNDLIRGEVSFDTTELGDFVIAKSPEEPLYHLAVVVDDLEMGVTHVLRGEDHISNTPRQILIQEAIEAPRPVYAHLPLILDSERKKLSKRKHGEVVWVDTYKKEGYLPEALLNYFALLGWNPGTDEEIFSLEKLVKAFDISKVHKGGAIFDVKKLRWVNKEHLKLNKEKIEEEIKNKLKDKFRRDIHPKLVEVVFERIEVISDIDKLTDSGELDYFFNTPEVDTLKLAWKNSTTDEAKRNLNDILPILDNFDAIKKLAEERGQGDVLWPLRFALSGRERSPDPFTLIEILGHEESQRRIKNVT
ncbi:glutamate--tRNA ligase [Candidatus Parcubacteria bacterium]|nr:glutamate--tRNA ligase [Candidatus Parcubacteria bacterium]